MTVITNSMIVSLVSSEILHYFFPGDRISTFGEMSQDSQDEEWINDKGNTEIDDYENLELSIFWGFIWTWPGMEG